MIDIDGRRRGRRRRPAPDPAAALRGPGRARRHRHRTGGHLRHRHTAPDQAAPVCLAFGPGPVNNGKAVIAAGVTMDIPEEGIVAGLTAAMQETDLLNLANPNVPDSLVAANDGLAVDQQAVGILQQTAAWGSAGDRMSPATAAAKFFTSMRDVDDWEAMPAAELAGIVQRSAWPDAYADEVPAARQFYRDHIGEVMAAQCPSRDADDRSGLVGAHP